jgi:hypothetical protein
MGQVGINISSFGRPMDFYYSATERSEKMEEGEM